jgi:hypothetical protein
MSRFQRLLWSVPRASAPPRHSFAIAVTCLSLLSVRVCGLADVDKDLPYQDRNSWNVSPGSLRQAGADIGASTKTGELEAKLGLGVPLDNCPTELEYFRTGQHPKQRVLFLSVETDLGNGTMTTEK